MPDARKSTIIGAMFAAGLLLAGTPSQAGLFGDHSKAPPANLSDGQVADIRRAIDEQRYVDAGEALDRAGLAGVQDPRISLLRGDLALAQGQYQIALDEFRTIEKNAATHAQALEGEGVV